MAVYLKGGFLHFLSRVSPIIIPLFSLVYGVIHDNYRGYLFFAGSIASDLFNAILKQLVYPLCSTKWYPAKLLGTCARPNPKAKCSIFKEPALLKLVTDGNSYGMPSGHAQFAAFTAVYWLMYLYDYRRYDTNYLLLTVPLMALPAFVSYSRVALSGCHTTQQVVIGTVIGGLLGYLYYLFSEWWLKRPVPKTKM